MTEMEQLRADCVLSAWTGGVGQCQWCAAELGNGGRRRTWCSDKCRRTWERNHLWARARAAARRRGKYQCAQCGQHKSEEDIEVNHIHPVAAHTGATHGRKPSCAHHQDNLEVLCRPCHVAVTREQRRQGLF